ncbi:hypothetical protein CGC21_5500 [Leishmania donovani]|uniref:Uncharacterized protein n=1 Tax=Leishmania donovani TaxID=5661 RepID=A0A504XX67_LEIDO|nr:hypothetical protein CGC21_5500 [Leishmania donovani]
MPPQRTTRTNSVTRQSPPQHDIQQPPSPIAPFTIGVLQVVLHEVDYGPAPSLDEVRCESVKAVPTHGKRGAAGYLQPERRHRPRRFYMERIGSPNVPRDDCATIWDTNSSHGSLTAVPTAPLQTARACSPARRPSTSQVPL